MVLFDESPYIKVSYEPENGLLVHEWLKYPANDTLAMTLLEKIYESFLSHAAVTKVLVKTDDAQGVFSQQIQTYIDTMQFPNILANTKVRYVVTVVPKSALSKLSTAQWQNALKKGERLILHNVGTEAEGRAWLKQFQ